jgi:HAMP domain-containing protein
LNTHYKRTFIALAIVFTGACAFLFNIFYQEARNTAITQLNEEEMIHAKQAARGIEDFFATWTRSLSSLSKMDEIIDNDAVGKRSPPVRQPQIRRSRTNPPTRRLMPTKEVLQARW